MIDLAHLLKCGFHPISLMGGGPQVRASFIHTIRSDDNDVEELLFAEE
jgi:hypothetical protein